MLWAATKGCIIGRRHRGEGAIAKYAELVKALPDDPRPRICLARLQLPGIPLAVLRPVLLAVQVEEAADMSVGYAQLFALVDDITAIDAGTPRRSPPIVTAQPPGFPDGPPAEFGPGGPPPDLFRNGPRFDGPGPMREELEVVSKFDKNADKAKFPVLSANVTEADSALLRETRYAQPALFAVEYSLAAQLLVDVAETAEEFRREDVVRRRPWRQRPWIPQARPKPSRWRSSFRSRRSG